MEAKKMKELESLEPAKVEKIMEIAERATLLDCIDALKEHGVEVSRATLSRFLKRYRAKNLVESGEGVKDSVESLAKRGESGTFRKGTMEAVRQRLFESALESENAEEARKLYVELLKEETKLKELELAERRVAVAEEAERNRRMELRARQRRKVELEAGAEPGEVADAEVKQLAETIPAATSAKEDELVKLMRDVAEIVNRGGESGEERLLEARAVIGREQRLWEK